MSQPRLMRRAFTLVELSVVLLIISLITAAGMTLGGDVLKAAARVKTQERLATIQQALDNYAKSNGYLPCPADRAFLPTSATFGYERRATATTCTTSAAGLVNVASTYIGGVPTRTLGLPDAYAGDSWGNKLLYAVSANHIGNITSYASAAGTITINYGDLTTNYAITTSATYVVVSHGPNGNGAFPFQGAAKTTCNVFIGIDSANCDDGDATFYDSAYNDGTIAAQFFDDFVVWGSNVLSRSRSAWYSGGALQAAPTAASDCPATSGCEPWCAQCKTNIGAGGLAYNSGTWTAGTQVLCSRIVMNSTPCEAVCVWGGRTAGGVVKCP